MKTINIPKVDKDIWIEYIKMSSSKYMLVLKKQTIAGLTIPKDSTINVEIDSLADNATFTMKLVDYWRVNKLLKFVYLEGLRNGNIKV